MLENEKYWNNPSTYEYNIMHYTVSCWISGEQGNREWLSNEGWEVWLKQTYTVLKYQGGTFLYRQHTL
jgi:hypothetical protein